MPALENVLELQKQGFSDKEISKKLMDRGVSTRDINEAMTQAKIKQAVTQSPPSEAMEMESSISDEESSEPVAAATEEYQPAPEQVQQEEYAPEEYEAPVAEEAPAEEYYYPEAPQAYAEGGEYYAPQGTVDTETIIEIAEQTVNEKFSEFEQKTGDLALFKNRTEEKLKDLDDRLKRIENSLDRIQQAIIGKVGEFGEAMTYIHKDLDNMHGTMSKLMSPMLDTYRELRKIASEKQ